MNLYEAIDELKVHGYLLTEWKITSDFDELSKADKESLTKAMNGAYTARKSGNKKNLAKYSAILKELLKKLSNPKAIKAVNKMLGKMDDKMGGATTTSTTTASSRLADYVSSKKYITKEEVIAFLDKLVKAGYIREETSNTYSWTTKGKEFTGKKFGCRWNVIYTAGKGLWIPYYFDEPDSRWYFCSYDKITTSDFEKYKAYFDVETTSVETSGETDTASTTIRDPKTVNALCTIFRLFIRALEQHKWIEYVPETSSWIWTTGGKMLTKRKWGSAWTTYINRVKEKYTIEPDSHIWVQKSKDTRDWGYVAIKDVTKLEIENTVKGFNLKTVYKTSGVLRYLTDKRLAGTPAPTAATANIPQLLYAFYKKMLDLHYIDSEFSFTSAGHGLIERKIGTTWMQAADGLKLSDYESFESDLTDGRIRPWLPAVGSTGKRPVDWHYYTVKRQPIQLSQVKAAIAIFDIKIDGIPTSSVSSTRETKPAEPAKPKDLELPATMEFIQYHFMISMTIEDSDDSDKMDPNIEKALDACTKIENMLEMLNKRYAPYGLKCTCDWDNDDAHYFYGKYWQVKSGTLSSGTSVEQYFDKYAKLPEEYKHAKELFKSNALNPSMNNRIIDNKVEMLRNYKAHRID